MLCNISISQNITNRYYQQMSLGKVVSYSVTIYINRKTLERHVVNCFILLNPLFPKHVRPENPIYLVSYFNLC